MHQPTSPAFALTEKIARSRREARPSALRTDTFTTLAQVEAFAEPWQELEAAASGHLDWFQTYDWCAKWMRHHGARRYRPHVLALWEARRLVALWPLMVERKRLGFRILKTLGDPHTQYSSLLTRDGWLAPQQADALRAAALSARVADAAVIRSVPDSSPLAAVISEKMKSSSLRSEASILDLSAYATPDDYAASLGKSQRRNRAKRRNAVLRSGDTRFLVLRPQDPDFQQLLHTCLAFKQDWLHQTGRVGAGLVRSGHGDFLGSLEKRPTGTDGPYLFALAVSGAPIAIESGFLRNGHFYSYIGGFDWAKRDLSPGKVLMEMIVGWLIGFGAKAYDLLANRSAYKESWSNRTVALDTYLADFTLIGGMYSGIWVPSARPALKKAYEALPVELRSRLRCLFQAKESGSFA
jgi:CelD/BcsL family acetyltransferase involved in cellulose biosynthesis